MTDHFKPFHILSEADSASHVHLAILLNIDRLPQMKGPGRKVGFDRESAVAHFASHVAQTLLTNARLVMGPPGMPTGASAAAVQLYTNVADLAAERLTPETQKAPTPEGPEAAGVGAD